MVRKNDGGFVVVLEFHDIAQPFDERSLKVTVLAYEWDFIDPRNHAQNGNADGIVTRINRDDAPLVGFQTEEAGHLSFRVAFHSERFQERVFGFRLRPDRVFTRGANGWSPFIIPK